jgi:hypothetical protein
MEVTCQFNVNKDMKEHRIHIKGGGSMEGSGTFMSNTKLVY